jgi:peptide/nickel transport system permease protein
MEIAADRLGGAVPRPPLPAPPRIRGPRLARRSVLAGALLAVLALTAAFAGALGLRDPVAQPDPVRLSSQPPSAAYPLGTDPFSRDVLSRVIYGGRVSLGIAALAVAVAMLIGTAYGAVAGQAGPGTDAVMMRAVDAFLSIPRILLVMALLALWGGVSLPALVALLGLTSWFGVSRLVRAEVLALRDRDFVVAARALGAGRLAILARHLLPNVVTPLLVSVTLVARNVILLEAGLSFLGIGVQQPTPSWGSIIRDGAEQVGQHWWISLFPGLAIALTVMALDALGDGLREALDPRQLPRP